MSANEILDLREEVAKIDVQNVLGSVESLPDQCRDAWENSSNVNFPDNYKQIDNLVMCGMGGSGLAGRIIESIYQDQIKIPLVRVNDYKLPGFVNDRSLVFCSSYSGTTEETIANAKQAVALKSKWTAIGTGGKLIEIAQQNNVPFYKIVPNFNPSNQPRMAIGYSVIGQIALCAKAGVLQFAEGEIQKVIDAMVAIQKECGPSVLFESNPAKQLAEKLIDKVILFIASEHLTGAMHTTNNQFNENSKTFTLDAQIPELNHHLMEGLKHPESNPENIFVFFANSNLYTDRIKTRFDVTRDVVAQNKIETYQLKLKSENQLTQAFELIQFGAYVNLYLSILYGQNPAPIPWVNYFKEKMGSL